MTTLTRLQESALNQLGYDGLCDEAKETLEDVINYGANTGIVGFTLYAETIEFFNKNKTVINDLITESSDSFGTSRLEMLSGFNCMQGLSVNDIEDGLYNENSDHETTVKNCLSWFALEEVARQLVDQ